MFKHYTYIHALTCIKSILYDYISYFKNIIVPVYQTRKKVKYCNMLLISNQGGMLSPVLFNINMDNLSTAYNDYSIAGNIGCLITFMYMLCR